MASSALLLTDRDVADLLSISRATVWRWRRDGLLPEPVRVNGSTRWKRADIEAAVAALGADA